nr:hypothetical protein [Kibdelosporangium sp. MJ126-NF4]
MDEPGDLWIGIREPAWIQREFRAETRIGALAQFAEWFESHLPPGAVENWESWNGETV